MEIELRVILLGVGMIILFVVALDFFKRKPAASKVRNEPRDFSPSLTAKDYVESDLDLYVASALSENANTTEASETINEYAQEYVEEYAEEYVEEESEPIPQPKIITVSIMSREQYGFEGASLMAALESAQLDFGKNDVFHRYEDDRILFSVVNAVEPGYFFIETLAEDHIPGITLILLPEQMANPLAVFEKFIRAAKQVAFALNGELLDMQHKPLTLETIELYRKEVQTSKR